MGMYFERQFREVSKGGNNKYHTDATKEKPQKFVKEVNFLL
jgi:hypothetical protein